MKPHISEPGIRHFLMKSLYHPKRDRFAWRFNLDAIEANIEKVGEAMDGMDYEGETLFIRGGSSDYILDEDWIDIKLIFPNAHLVTLDGAGHWLHAEQPENFVREVASFLSD
jgi:pimeloyl-ACP methyl ester carboxylesterase